MRKKFVAAVLAAAVVATATPVASVDAAKAVKKTYTIGVGKKATKKVAKKIKSVKTSNKKIVAVKKKGAKKFILTAKKAGTAKVTVKFGKKTLKATVKVGATKVKAVQKKVEVSVASAAGVTIAVKGTNAKKDTFKWSSSNKKVAKVAKAKSTANKNGKATNKVTGVATGSAVITVKSKNTGKKVKINVTVTSPAAVKVTTNSAVSGSATTGSATTGSAASGSATQTPVPTQTPGTTVSNGAVSATSLKAKKKDK